MKLPKSPGRKARIEIIPMIDTMFFLLVFFMLASLSMIQQQTVPVNLPKAEGVQGGVQQVAVLTVTRDGKLFYNKEEVATAVDAVLRLMQESRKGSNPAVIINADREARHGRVVELLDAVQQCGPTKVAIAINPAGSKAEENNLQ